MTAFEALAKRIGEAINPMPEGAGIVIFLAADQGATYDCSVASNMPPDDFAPILRHWLERYDKGETTPYVPQ